MSSFLAQKRTKTTTCWMRCYVTGRLRLGLAALPKIRKTLQFYALLTCWLLTIFQHFNLPAQQWPRFKAAQTFKAAQCVQSINSCKVQLCFVETEKPRKVAHKNRCWCKRAGTKCFRCVRAVLCKKKIKFWH